MFLESFDLKRITLGASVTAASVMLVSAAGAVPYTSVQNLRLGGTAATNDLGTGGAGGATVYAGGNVRNGSSNVIGRVRGVNATNGSATINGTVAIGSGSANDVSTIVQGTAGTKTTGVTLTVGNLRVDSPATQGAGVTVSGSSNTNFDLSGASAAVRNVQTTLATQTADTGYAFTTAPTTTVSVGTAGYTAITVTNALQTNLVLSARSASAYFFVYLQGGIASGGRITLDQTANSKDSVANVIVSLGANSTINTGLTTVGSYFTRQGTTLTNNGTINGGVFIGNATSTTATELVMGANSVITSNPWSGVILANAPEPASMALMAVGLAGLGAATRYRRRKV